MNARCRLIDAIAALSLLTSPAFSQSAGIITTVAGSGSLGNSGNGGPATSATLGGPAGVVVDKAGNIYIADSIFGVVRKVNTAGIISTFAGGGGPASLGDGGPATSARLVLPPSTHLGLAVDGSGNLYIADYGDSRIRKVDTAGIITTVAGASTSLGLGGFSGDSGPATGAMLNSPTGVALDSAGNMYIADFGNNRVRKVDASGKITTFAGIGNPGGSDAGDGGPAASAQLSSISDVAVDGAGNVYIADLEHIRKVSPSGVIGTAAHGFFGTCALTPAPVANADVSATGLSLDGAGNLFIADRTGGCIQELSTSGTVTTVAGGGTNLNGDGGPATAANIGSPPAVSVDSKGNIFLAEGSVIRKVSAQATPPSTPPSFSTSGVVNGASFAAGGLVAGEIGTIFGTNLTSSTGINLTSSLPLPTEFQNVSVTINGYSAPIFAVDNLNGQQQINFQVPWEVQSLARIQVSNNGATSSTVIAPVQIAQPAVFNYSSGGETFGAILHSNYQLANTADPAKAGETVLIYCTGLGAVTPEPKDGVAATGQTTTATPIVTIGGANAPVGFSGLAPAFVGLYQINAQIPTGLAAGNQAVVIIMNGTASKSVLLPVE